MLVNNNNTEITNKVLNSNLNSTINNNEENQKDIELLIIGTVSGATVLVLVIVFIYCYLRRVKAQRLILSKKKIENRTNKVIDKINENSSKDSARSDVEIKKFEFDNTKDENRIQNKLISSSQVDGSMVTSHKEAINVFREKIQDINNSLKENITYNASNNLNDITKNINNISNDNNRRQSISQNKTADILNVSEVRSDPGDSLFDVKIEEIREQRLLYEKEEEEAQKRERELNREYMEKIMKIVKEEKTLKLDNHIHIVSEMNQKFKINENAIITDYSIQIQDMPEVFKNIDDGSA
jgi:hypothetical protein